LYTGHIKVSDTRYVDFCARSKVCSSDIAIKGDGAITFSFRRSYQLSGSEVLETVDEDVWMGISENEGAEFHDGNEAGEVEDFCVGIAAVDNT
jgi:hypothetical protein